MPAADEKIAFLALHHAARPGRVGRYLRDVAAEGATVILTTESSKRMRSAAARHLPGWTVTRQGEYLIAWKRSVWAGVPRIRHRSRVTRVHRGRDSWRDVWLGSRLLKHRATGQRVRFDAAHMPSAVQSGDRFRVDSRKQVQAWKQGMTRHGARIRRMNPDVIPVIGMDTNVDYRRKVWRDEVGRRVGLPSCWDDSRPRTGTHRGDRLIDVIHTSAPIVASGLTRTSPPVDVDHHGISATLNLAHRRQS